MLSLLIWFDTWAFTLPRNPLCFPYRQLWFSRHVCRGKFRAGWRIEQIWPDTDNQQVPRPSHDVSPVGFRRGGRHVPFGSSRPGTPRPCGHHEHGKVCFIVSWMHVLFEVTVAAVGSSPFHDYSFSTILNKLTRDSCIIFLNLNNVFLPKLKIDALAFGTSWCIPMKNWSLVSNRAQQWWRPVAPATLCLAVAFVIDGDGYDVLKIRPHNTSNQVLWKRPITYMACVVFDLENHQSTLKPTRRSKQQSAWLDTSWWKCITYNCPSSNSPSLIYFW